MKNYLLGIAALITPFLLWYLLFSFIFWNFSINSWHWGVRIMYFFLSLSSFSSSLEFYEEYKD